MNSFQESKNELEAAIRYAENAISSAQGTIESMEFRQEMAKKQYAEQTGREAALEAEVKALTEANMSLVCDNDDLKDELFKLRKEKEASSGPCGCQAYRDLEEARGRAEGEVELLQRTVKELESKVQGQYDDIVQLERDLTVKTAQAGAWKKEADNLKAEVNALEQPERATMPVIPRDVAIAIFREGVAHGVSSACDEIDNDAGITIEETGYTGDFEVSFNRWIDLSDHLDLDWMRDKVGDYDEASVIEALKTLCADKGFECRIHGVDDNTIDLTKNAN